VKLELKRSQRYLSFISFINVDTTRFLKSGELPDPSPNNEVYRRLRQLIKGSLRQTDIISGFYDGKICLLLTETGREGADKVRFRLQDSIKYFLREVFDSPMNWRVEMRVGSFPENGTTPNSFYDSLRDGLSGCQKTPE